MFSLNNDLQWRSKSLNISLSCITLNLSYSLRAFCSACSCVTRPALGSIGSSFNSKNLVSTFFQSAIVISTCFFAITTSRLYISTSPAHFSEGIRIFLILSDKWISPLFFYLVDMIVYCTIFSE